jgi:hypothetical protein
MDESRLRLLDEGKLKQVKLDLSQEKLVELIVDLKILKYLHEPLEFTAIDSDPELTIIFKIRKRTSLSWAFQKYLIYSLTLLVVVLRLLGILFLIYFIFDVLRGI